MAQIYHKQRLTFLLENSKNDPIPELAREKTRFAIILFGPPAAGKSTFVEQYIGKNVASPPSLEDRNRISNNRSRFAVDRRVGVRHDNSFLQSYTGNQFKIVNSDDVNFWRTKDHGVWDKRSSAIRDNQLGWTISSGTNFIYDTTGLSYNRIEKAMRALREHEYKVIFIQILSNMYEGLQRNFSRERTVKNTYLFRAYMTIPHMIDRFAALEPDNYYFVHLNDGHYDFYRRVNDKYYQRNKIGEYVDCEDIVGALLGTDQLSKLEIKEWLRRFGRMKAPQKNMEVTA